MPPSDERGALPPHIRDILNAYVKRHAHGVSMEAVQRADAGGQTFRFDPSDWDRDLDPMSMFTAAISSSRLGYDLEYVKAVRKDDEAALGAGDERAGDQGSVIAGTDTRVTVAPANDAEKDGDSYVEAAKRLLNEKRHIRLASIQESLEISGQADCEAPELTVQPVTLTAEILEEKSVPGQTIVELAQGGLMANYDASAEDRIIARRVAALQSAFKEQADFIVFPEFSLPAGQVSQSNKGPVDAVVQDHSAVGRKIFEQALDQDYYPKNEPFVVFGSAHCGASGFNVGVIHPGALGRDGWKIERVREDLAGSRREVRTDRRTKVERGPTSQAKLFPARRAGEKTAVPIDPTFRIYQQQDVGYVAVLICSDAIDLNQVMRIVDINERNGWPGRINMVLVPAFNFSHKLLYSCSALSYAAQTVVAVVNASGDFKKHPVFEDNSLMRSEIFICGKDLEKLVEQDIVTVKQGENNIVYYDINMFKVSDIVKRNKNKFDKNTQIQSGTA